MGDGAGGAVIRGAGIARAEAGAARAATGAVGAAEEAGVAARAAGVAAEARGTAQVAASGVDQALGRVGEMPLNQAVRRGGEVAMEAGLVGAAGLAAWSLGDVAAGLLTDREREFTDRVSRLGGKSSTAVNAMFEAEARAGGAWADPTWPVRLHAMLTSGGEKPQWAADAGIPAHENPSDYSTDELRSGWVAWLYGHLGPEMSRPLTAQQQAAVERYLREQAAKRRPRPGEGYKVDEATPGDRTP